MFWLSFFTIACSIGVGVGTSASAYGADVLPELPYAKRTESYAGWSSTVRGDLTQIGMAGAVVGIADSFMSSADNPAGSAMTLSGISLTTNFNRIQDQEIQTYEMPGSIANIGIAATKYPWGFSAGWWTTADEGRPYFANGTTQQVDPQIQVREFRFSGARLFRAQRLSVGASLFLVRGQETLGFPNSPENNAGESEFQLSASVGVLWQIEKTNRFFLGASFTPACTLEFDDAEASPTGITDFFKPIEMPWRLAVGIGWLPNRFFRAGVALYTFGALPNTGLLRDQSVRISEYRTVQPRLGARYRFADTRIIRASAGLGTYVEPSGIALEPTRIHGTASVDVEIWTFDMGFAIDRAPGYRNSIFSVALDIVRTAEALELIARRVRAQRQGWFPTALVANPADLARPINPYWHPSQGVDLFEIGRQLPDRLERKMEQLGDALDEASRPIAEKIEKKNRQRRAKAHEQRR